MSDTCRDSDGVFMRAELLSFMCSDLLFPSLPAKGLAFDDAIIPKRRLFDHLHQPGLKRFFLVYCASAVLSPSSFLLDRTFVNSKVDMV